MLPANTGLHVIQYPSGRFGFVGRVPQALAYRCDDAEILAAAHQCGATIARGIAKNRGIAFETVAFDTREAAIAEAARLGFSVANA